MMMTKGKSANRRDGSQDALTYLMLLVVSGVCVCVCACVGIFVFDSNYSTCVYIFMCVYQFSYVDFVGCENAIHVHEHKTLRVLLLMCTHFCGLTTTSRCSHKHTHIHSYTFSEIENLNEINCVVVVLLEHSYK